MQLTPEQQAEIERQRSDGRRRLHVTMTDEQRAEYRRLVALEDAGMEENKAYARKLMAAAAEPGFSGDLRRAIGRSRHSPDELAVEIGVAPELLDRFCTGEADLPTAAIDRLVETLGLRLMAEIS